MRPTHPHNPRRRTLFITLALSLGTLTTGCATLQSPEESLQDRAQAFWDARKINDDLTAYKYEAASQTGETSLQNYLKKRATIEYKRADINKINLLSKTEAEITLTLAYAIPAAGIKKPITTETKDYWVMIEGQWYHINKLDLPKPNESSPPASKTSP